LSETVLDSSAILAVLFDEPGAAMVLGALPGALLSSVNAAEVLTRLTDRGMVPSAALEAVEALGLEVVDFDLGQALLTASLRPETRALGLSLGDRACLALARSRGWPAMTADRAWARLADPSLVLIR
jgi:PIN domain nuclease of toxin-antitoxin system